MPARFWSRGQAGTKTKKKRLTTARHDDGYPFDSHKTFVIYPMSWNGIWVQEEYFVIGD
jgi:hypothetical protein